jgi:hypothetical protein
MMFIIATYPSRAGKTEPSRKDVALGTRRILTKTTGQKNGKLGFNARET